MRQPKHAAKRAYRPHPVMRLSDGLAQVATEGPRAGIDANLTYPTSFVVAARRANQAARHDS